MISVRNYEVVPHPRRKAVLVTFSLPPGLSLVRRPSAAAPIAGRIEDDHFVLDMGGRHGSVYLPGLHPRYRTAIAEAEQVILLTKMLDGSYREDSVLTPVHEFHMEMTP